MKRPSKLKIRAVAVAAVIAVVAFGLMPAPPAHASWPLEEQIHAESVSKSATDSTELPLILPIGVDSSISLAADVPVDDGSCRVKLSATSQYWKPSWSVVIREQGDAEGTSNCGSTRVPVIKVTATVTHHCVGPTYSNSDSGSGAGPGPVPANAYQEVTAFTPTQWCAYGTLISWRYTLYARSNKGASANLCIAHQANYGGDISRVKCGP